MLKNHDYDGTYHDENLSVSVLLENPLDYGLESLKLVFGVTIKDKITSIIPRLENFAFYIMEEANHLYNVQNKPYPKTDLQV